MKRIALATAVALLAAACGGEGDQALQPDIPQDAIVIRASTDLALGAERLLLAVATPGGARLGAPDLDVAVSLSPVDDPANVQQVDGAWIWAIPDVSGLYRFAVNFDRPGVWAAELSVGGRALDPVLLDVRPDPLTPAVGTAAPASDTPTAGPGDELSAITTDTDADARFYALSVADAVSSGRRSVVVFATPKFCQTAVCGPTLESVKPLADEFPDVNFVHVEVYDLSASPADATSIDQLVLHQAVVDWALTSEPWVFVVDEQGLVSGRFEGVVDPDEIRALLG